MTPERSRRMPRAAVVLLALLLGCSAVATGLNPSPEDILVIEEDWRKQDGIGTERASASYAAAIELILERANRC